MKNLILLTTLAMAATSAFAQTAGTNNALVQNSSTTSSSAQSGAMAIGGGSVSSSINNRTTSRGGAGGAGGNAAGGSSAVTVNVGSSGASDPSGSSGTGANPTGVANAQDPSGTSQPKGTYKESIETVGSPGSMSYGVSFSQFNCANTAGVGAGFMGGAFQIGIGKESNPCNDRANASALYQIATTLAPTNAPLSAQLYHAAILLIGNSTSDTQAALSAAGVSDWAKADPSTPQPAIVPPAPPPADEGKATPVPTPAVASTPLPQATPEPTQTADEVKKEMYQKPAPASTEMTIEDARKMIADGPAPIAIK